MRYKYLFLSFAVFIMSSCTKEFLDITPQDRLTADNFYRNETEIKAATASLYGFPWFDFNDKFYWLTGDCMSGNMYYTWDQEGQFFFFSFTEGNAYLSSGWRGLYRVISYANSIINDMPRAAEGNVPASTIAQALGEARFVRGVAYYFIAEMWGEAPIVENSTELVAANNLFLPKNTRANLYEFVRRDLVYASENLPAADPQAGRVTKWSALGMLAKLHLTMAQQLSDANSASNFGKAKEYARQVIETSGLTLMPNYADLFEVANNNNPESLFALQWMEGGYAIGNSRQANWARSSQITSNSECWGGGKCASYDFVQDVEVGDLRRKAIFMAPGDYYPTINKKAGGYTYKIINRSPTDPNVVLEGAAPVLNNIKKYVVGSAEDTGGKVSTGQATAVNQYVMRLADVYLIYAEAELAAQSATSDAKALQYFNAIRSRAGLSGKTSLTFADILKERRIEFGLESLYWLDLKRLFYRDPAAAMDHLNAQDREITYYRDQSGTAADENQVAGYILLPPQSKITISANQMWLPIPASEVVSNPKLGPSVPAEDYKFQ